MRCRYEIRPLANNCHRDTYLVPSTKTIEIVVYQKAKSLQKATRSRRHIAETEELTRGNCAARISVSAEEAAPWVLAHEAYHAALRFRSKLRLPPAKSWRAKEERIAYLVDSITWSLHDCVRRARREFNKRRKT